MQLHCVDFKIAVKDGQLFFFFEKEDFLKNGCSYDFETFTNGFSLKNWIRISCHPKTKLFFFQKSNFCKGCQIEIETSVGLSPHAAVSWLHIIKWNEIKRDTLHTFTLVKVVFKTFVSDGSTESSQGSSRFLHSDHRRTSWLNGHWIWAVVLWQFSANR